MSADLLRRAASLMREHAKDTSDYGRNKWRAVAVEPADENGGHVMTQVGNHSWPIAQSDFAPDALHVASWHPVVALAVADWLDGCADRCDQTADVRLERDPEEWAWLEPAIAVARAYLNEPA